MRLLQVVPGAQLAGLLVRQKHVAFGLRTGAVHHHVDQVAGLNVNTAVGRHELLDRNQAFRLVSEIDNYIFVGDVDNAALQQFAFVRRREVAVVVDELLVFRLFSRQWHAEILLIWLHGHSQKLPVIILQRRVSWYKNNASIVPLSG